MANSPDKSIENFYQTIMEPEKLSDAQLIEIFSYYLQVRADAPIFYPRNIDHCFEACDLSVPTWTRIYLNTNSKGKGAKFIKPKGGGYKLARSTSDTAKAFLRDEVSKAQTSKVLTDLNDKFTESVEKTFLEEAVLCFNVGAHRAAIVMVWVLTVDHMYRYVLIHKLADFQAALSKQTDKKLNSLIIKNRDDFAELKESKFIELLKTAGIISKGVHKILDEKLGARNDAGHPSTVTFSSKKTEVFIEDLVTNVILRYPIS